MAKDADNNEKNKKTKHVGPSVRTQRQKFEAIKTSNKIVARDHEIQYWRKSDYAHR